MLVSDIFNISSPTEPTRDPGKSRGMAMPRMLVFWISQVFGVLISILTLTWVFKHRGGFAWNSEPKKQFSWHPTFMIIGMVYLFGHGLIMFRVFPNLPKWRLKIVHMAINLTAGAMALFAFLAVVDERNVSKKKHFLSLHSWIGIVALSFFAIQWTVGLVVFFLPCATNWLRSRVVPTHIVIGKFIFILSVIAAVTGIKTTSKAEFDEEQTLLNILGIFVLIYLFYHLYVLSKNSYKYSRSSTGSRPPSIVRNLP